MGMEYIAKDIANTIIREGYDVKEFVNEATKEKLERMGIAIKIEKKKVG